MEDTQSNRSDFLKTIQDVMEVSNFPKPVGKMWWGMLSQYSLHDIRVAISMHAAVQSTAPTPSDIIKMVTKHPAAEQAWNALPKNEMTGGMVSTEMMTAYISCQDCMERNDMVAARMAFIETYRAQVAQSLAQRKEPKFTYSGPSIGSPDQRNREKQAAIESAKTLGWITNERAQLMLEHAEQQDFSVQRLEYEGTQGSSEVKTEALKEIRNTLKGFKGGK